MPTLDPNRIISGIIYGLHNGDGEIRYIGYTTMTVARRLNAHRKALSEGQTGRIAHNKGKTLTEGQRAKMRYQRHVTMHVSKGIVGPRCTNCGTRKESPYNAERPLEYTNVA